MKKTQFRAEKMFSGNVTSQEKSKLVKIGYLNLSFFLAKLS